MTNPRTPRPSTAASSQQRGAMLLEALIAILIFSLGILGIVGLQANAVKQSSDARYRTEAALLADQLMGTIWSGDRSSFGAMQNLYNTCSSGCAGYTTWAASVASRLPGVDLAGDTKPTINVDGTGIIQIHIYWKAPNDDAADAAHTYAMEAQIVP